MDDISTSAFELDQIRQARKERILAGVGDEEGKEDGDIDVDGEGQCLNTPGASCVFSYLTVKLFWRPWSIAGLTS